MANSRALVRSDTLLAPKLSGRLRIRNGCAQFTRETRHFYCRKARFEPFVAAFETCAIDGLFERVASEHAEDDGQATVHLSELQTTRSFGTDVIVMRGFSAQ